MRAFVVFEDDDDDDDGFLVGDFASTTTSSHKKNALSNDSFSSSFAPNQRVRNSCSIRYGVFCAAVFTLSFSSCARVLVSKFFSE